MIKPTRRKGFNFLRSYFDVLNKIPTDAEKLSFLLAIINKQFLDIDPEDLSLLADLAYESQRHAIEKSVKGWKLASNNDTMSDPIPPPMGDPLGGVVGDPKEEQEKEKEQLQEEEQEKVSKLKFTKYHFKKSLLELGVDKQKLEDWCKARDKKKLVYTQTALDGFLNEIKKSKLSPAEAVKISAENGWGGFKASWLNKPSLNGQEKPQTLAQKMRQDYGISS